MGAGANQNRRIYTKREIFIRLRGWVQVYVKKDVKKRVDTSVCVRRRLGE